MFWTARDLTLDDLPDLFRHDGRYSEKRTRVDVSFQIGDALLDEKADLRGLFKLL